MTTPEKAPCIKGAACPASPFFDGLTPGSETHNDYMRSRKTLDAGEGSAADAAVRAAHADSADNADIGAIAEGIAKQREFQEAYGTTRPYGFTAGQLAAFGKGQSSPMAELAAGGNGIYLKPEYINASINSRIPEPVRQKAGELANQAGDAWRHDKAVLDNTAGKIRNQLGSHLDGSWDNRKTFGANAADKLAGSAGIMKTGLDGLGETTAGKAVGKAVDKVMHSFSNTHKSKDKISVSISGGVCSHAAISYTGLGGIYFNYSNDLQEQLTLSELLDRLEFTVSVVPLLYSSIGYISFSNIVNELDIDKKLDEIKINWITYTNRIETAEVLPVCLL